MHGRAMKKCPPNLRVWLRPTSLTVLILALFATGPAAAERVILRLGVSTTVENSGLLAHLLPRFSKATGIRARSIVRGTGEILRVARAGDVDLFIAHDRPAEIAFVRAGHGIARRDLMSNHFLIAGPKDDPAGIRELSRFPLAFARIAARRAFFVSRGDDSGTHRAERAQWHAAGIDPRKLRQRWYMESGAGMGATLNIAAGRGAYIFADSGTWLAYRNKSHLAKLVSANGSLVNRYGVTLVASEKIGAARAKSARQLFSWLIGIDGQRAIGRYRIGGVAPFTPALPPPR